MEKAEDTAVGEGTGGSPAGGVIEGGLEKSLGPVLEWLEFYGTLNSDFGWEFRKKGCLLPHTFYSYSSVCNWQM